MAEKYIAFEHPTLMPELLSEDLILSFSNENDLVLDTFYGAGTVLKMARLNNRNYVGVEISSVYCKISEKRVLSKTSSFLKNQVMTV